MSSRSRRWKRYTPPQETRTEDGRLADPPAPPATAPRSSKSKARKPAARRPARTTSTRPGERDRSEVERAQARTGLKIGLASTAVVIAVVTAVAVGQGGSDGDGGGGDGDVQRDTLSTAFITKALEAAKAEQGDDAPIRIELSEYDMSVEYFDAATQKIRSIDTDTYSDRYRVEVQDNYYDDYQPRPFSITLADPAQILKEAEAVLRRADDPYRFSVTIEADRVSGRVTLHAEASGEEDAESDVVLGEASGPADPVPSTGVPDQQPSGTP